MKKYLSLVLCLALAIILGAGCEKITAGAGIGKDLLITEKTAQYFTDEAVPDAVIDLIIKAGQNATSAMNKQNWHFSSVTNKELLNEFKEKMAEGIPAQMKNAPNPKAQFGDGPLNIIVSCTKGSEYDAGLTSQIMTDYAILSGYGVKIVSSPCKLINENYKEKLGIPAGMDAVAVLLIGKVKNVEGLDSVTSASARKPISEILTKVD